MDHSISIGVNRDYSINNMNHRINRVYAQTQFELHNTQFCVTTRTLLRHKILFLTGWPPKLPKRLFTQPIPQRIGLPNSSNAAKTLPIPQKHNFKFQILQHLIKLI